jgi:hypothetical protein
MMLGGVGFQAGLDDVRRQQIEAQRQASVPDVIKQLQDLKALLRASDAVRVIDLLVVHKRADGVVHRSISAVRPGATTPPTLLNAPSNHP